MRNQVILLYDYLFVKLLLSYLYNKRVYCGYKSLIYEVRRKYWIIGFCSMFKVFIVKCIICRKFRKKSLDQLMGQISFLRVVVGFFFFFNIVIDMFGFVYIKFNRKILKEVQVVIFVCMIIRVVYLEFVNDKIFDVFLMVFRRFASLRGYSSVCWSDCGINFVGV